MATDPKVFGQDPFHLALFLSPLAELLQQGAGSRLFAGALHGLSQRDVLAQQQRETEEAKAERRAEKEETRRERRLRLRMDAIHSIAQNPGLASVWNQFFEQEGLPPIDATAVPPKPTGRVRVTSPSGQELQVSPEAALTHERAVATTAAQGQAREAAAARASFTATRDQLVRKIHERTAAGDVQGARSAAAALDDLANRAPGIGTTGESELQKATRIGRGQAEKAETEELRQGRLRQLTARGGRRGGGGGRRSDREDERGLEAIRRKADAANASYNAAKARAEANPTDANKAAVQAAFARGEALGRQLNRELQRQGRLGGGRPIAPAAPQQRKADPLGIR